MDPLGFINQDGSPSENGYKYIAWMEAQFLEADRSNDVALINSISGDIQHYYINVTKLKTMSPESWLRDYRNSFARSGYRNYLYTMEQIDQKSQEQSQLEANTRKAAELEAGFAAFKEAADAEKTKMQQDMADLRAELDKLMAGGKKRASKASAAVVDEDDDTDEV